MIFKKFPIIFLLPLSVCFGSSLMAATLQVDGSCPTANPSAPFCNNGTTHRSLQGAIDAASDNDILQIASGIYVENIIVTKKLELAGTGRDQTILIPAVSKPNPCTNSALCQRASTASNVILVQADHVSIHDLTIDGNNPNLTSGVVVGGVDVDARNGIIQNYLAGNYDELQVYNVTVKNIFLRGLHMNWAHDFNIHDNLFQNIQGNPSGSIAVFNYGGGGLFEHNTVEDAIDGIVSDESVGTRFLNNHVSRCVSGIHTNNAGDFAGSTADLIAGNLVENSSSGGFGIWVFIPYLAPTIQENTIRNVDVGLAVAGNRPGSSLITSQFTNNVVDGQNKAGSIGVYVTTDQFGFGSNHVSAEFFGNTIRQTETGFYLQEQANYTLTLNASNNFILLNTTPVENTGTSLAHFKNNFWGSATGPANLPHVESSPWCLTASCLPVTVQFTSSTSSIVEGSAGAPIRITLSEPLDVDISVNFTLTGQSAHGHGEDYTPDSGTVVIPAGQVLAVLPITIIDDSRVEGSETALISLVPQLASLGSISIQTLTIVDNDLADIILNKPNGSLAVTEGGATDQFTLVLASQPSFDVVVDILTDSQTITTPASLTFTSAQWNVAQTVVVAAVDDAVVEGAHTSQAHFGVASLDTIYNGFLIPELTISITDNDSTSTSSSSSSSSPPPSSSSPSISSPPPESQQPPSAHSLVENPSSNPTSSPASGSGSSGAGSTSDSGGGSTGGNNSTQSQTPGSVGEGASPEPQAVQALTFGGCSLLLE